MHQIVVLDGYVANPGDLSWSGLEAFGPLTLYDRTPDELIIERIGTADIVFTNKTPITRETLDACPNLRFICVLATGYNVIDCAAASDHGVLVANIPNYSTNAVSQFVFALLLEICHHVGHHALEVSKGRWSDSKDFCFWDYPLMELAGKTIGVIGFGRIGQQTARIARAIGMNVIANSRQQPAHMDSELAEYVSLDDLFRRSDVISLHCPLFPSTQGMINAGSIAAMKDGVIIINTARGPLIIEEDMKAALDSGKVAAYATDVVSVEPIKKDNVLLQAKNCLITPHIAWATKESRQRLMDIAVENLTQFIKGTPINIVNQ